MRKSEKELHKLLEEFFANEENRLSISLNDFHYANIGADAQRSPVCRFHRTMGKNSRNATRLTILVKNSLEGRVYDDLKKTLYENKFEVLKVGESGGWDGPWMCEVKFRPNGVKIPKVPNIQTAMYYCPGRVFEEGSEAIYWQAFGPTGNLNSVRVRALRKLKEAGFNVSRTGKGNEFLYELTIMPPWEAIVARNVPNRTKFNDHLIECPGCGRFIEPPEYRGCKCRHCEYTFEEVYGQSLISKEEFLVAKNKVRRQKGLKYLRILNPKFDWQTAEEAEKIIAFPIDIDGSNEDCDSDYFRQFRNGNFEPLMIPKAKERQGITPAGLVVAKSLGVTWESYQQLDNDCIGLLNTLANPEWKPPKEAKKRGRELDVFGHKTSLRKFQGQNVKLVFVSDDDQLTAENFFIAR